MQFTVTDGTTPININYPDLEYITANAFSKANSQLIEKVNGLKNKSDPIYVSRHLHQIPKKWIGIQTNSYTTKGDQHQVDVFGFDESLLDYIADQVDGNPEMIIPIVEDMIDNGPTFQKLIDVAAAYDKTNDTNIAKRLRLFTVYAKDRPEAYRKLQNDGLVETIHELDPDLWAVFPHEISDWGIPNYIDLEGNVLEIEDGEPIPKSVIKLSTKHKLDLYEKLIIGKKGGKQIFDILFGENPNLNPENEKEQNSEEWLAMESFKFARKMYDSMKAEEKFNPKMIVSLSPGDYSEHGASSLYIHEAFKALEQYYAIKEERPARKIRHTVMRTNDGITNMNLSCVPVDSLLGTRDEIKGYMEDEIDVLMVGNYFAKDDRVSKNAKGILRAYGCNLRFASFQKSASLKKNVDYFHIKSL